MSQASPTYNFIVILITSPPAPTHTLSLHDALPISPAPRCTVSAPPANVTASAASPAVVPLPPITVRSSSPAPKISRSEEHTSELQSRFDLVCRLLLEKKKNTITINAISATDMPQLH